MTIKYWKFLDTNRKKFNANSYISIGSRSTCYDSTSITSGAGLFTFYTSGTFIINIHIPVGTDSNTTRRSYMEFRNYTSNTILYKAIGYGDYVTHDFNMVMDVYSGLQIGVFTT